MNPSTWEPEPKATPPRPSAWEATPSAKVAHPSECDPRPDRNDGGERGTDRETNQRHQSLKHAEEQRDQKRTAQIQFLHGNALTHGHRKRIHGEADAD